MGVLEPLATWFRWRNVGCALADQAAAQFGVSVSSASRWSEQFRQEGQLAPKPSGSDHASHRIEAQAELILTPVRRAAARALLVAQSVQDEVAGMQGGRAAEAGHDGQPACT